MPTCAIIVGTCHDSMALEAWQVGTTKQTSEQIYVTERTCVVGGVLLDQLVAVVLDVRSCSPSQLVEVKCLEKLNSVTDGQREDWRLHV